jgi:hypothetical protein
VRARVLRALTIAVAIVAVTVGCGSPKDGGDQQRALVENGYAKASGGVLLALPTTLPEGYELTRFWSVANVYGETGAASSIARSAEFSGPEGTVRVCEEVASVPGSLCPKSNLGLTESRSGLIRTVSTGAGTTVSTVNVGTASRAAQAKTARAQWAKLRYSRAIAKWSWI